MPQLDLERAQGMLKIRYQDPYFNQMVLHTRLLDKINKSSQIKQGPDGKYTELSNMFGGPEGNGFRSSNGNLPVPGAATFVNGRVYMKTQLHVCQMNRAAMARAVRGKSAFADWAEVTLKPSAKIAAHELDRALVGFGAGAICRIDGSPSATSIPIDAPYGLANDTKGWLPGIRRGMRLVAAPSVDGTGIRSGGKSILVISVNKGGNSGGGTISTSDVPSDWADNDYLFRGDDLGNNAPEDGSEVEPMGLLGMIDDGTQLPVFQNIDRNTYDEWKAQMLDANAFSSGAPTENLFMKAYDDVMEIGGGQVDVFCSTLTIFRAAFKQFVTAAAGIQRTAGQGGTYQAGANRLQIRVPMGDSLVDLVAYPKMAPGKAFGLDLSTIWRYHLESGAFEWVDWTGSMFHQVSVGLAAKDAVWFYGRNELEFGCTNPQANIQIYGISEAAGV